jgi:hypothetical protein
VKSLIILYLTLVIALGFGCHTSTHKSGGHDLTASEALALAVELANQECSARYSAEPFTSESYKILFEDGRWHWGALDPGGDGGYSAVVSFNARGEDPRVEIFLSTDARTPPPRSKKQQD